VISTSGGESGAVGCEYGRPRSVAVGFVVRRGVAAPRVLFAFIENKIAVRFM